jgi:soluble lytic murein transglycosylase-like protein
MLSHRSCVTPEQREQRGAHALRDNDRALRGVRRAIRLRPLMLAAQGYQESQLRQEARSHVGAIGMMRIMPATGHEMRVGDIRSIEANIHA